ncbi:gln-glu non-discriminatory tRNA synthetase [Reticulomyxa filosa]|uniref:Gln-glu non-discriminatory tRNA synthetase n=1 Tax=Reticulomyxa filosa TaxID=46433 RepID=X6NIZ2_RETFI|nr:gln-glu non-discriminatory tRNA synthetase [Reticulomyxa filosa]|eukprot:ETO26295.1 gln-glu non-discriminatory tRNA synthetase [Reticulomyxa filosa]
MGRVVTRFPPEPSGYLHIGHAKAVLLNWEVSRRFNGRFLLRFDDTNPSKEKAEFEESILRDLKLLGVTPDSCSHTSDYFAYYIQVCTRIIEEGKAYCDKTPQEKVFFPICNIKLVKKHILNTICLLCVIMSEQRLHKQTNEYRVQPIAENLRLWKEMQEGTPEGQQCIVRMKMDMTSDNGTLRDPTMFRVNVDVPHHRTGFVHFFFLLLLTMRNCEQQQQHVIQINIDHQIDKLTDANSKPIQHTILLVRYRQEFTRTELSKRKLSALIDQGKVKGWNDPRLPTIQGIMRRGLQLEALREFVRDQAMTQRNNKQEWDKLWTYNKKILDPIAGRYYCVSAENKVLVEITNIKENTGVSVQLHPQNPSRGTKVLHVAKEVFIEQFDADLVRKDLDKGKKQFILMSVGVVSIDEIVFSPSHPDHIEKLRVTHLPEEKNFKDKLKVTWVVNSENMVWVKLVELDYLFTADGEPVDQTWFETLAIAEPSISLLSRGDVIQFMKRGFFIVDKPYLGRREDPGVLIFVPDGKAKAMSALSEATNKVEISTK